MKWQRGYCMGCIYRPAITGRYVCLDCLRAYGRVQERLKVREEMRRFAKEAEEFERMAP